MRTSAVKRLVDDLEKDRAEFLASAALLDKMIARLLVVSHNAKPKATRKPRLITGQDKPA